MDASEAARSTAHFSKALNFNATEKRVNGFTGCNNLTGTFLQDGSNLKILLRSQTRLRCGRVIDDMEARLLTALKRTTAFHICCSTLELRDGKVLATFRTTR